MIVGTMKWAAFLLCSFSCLAGLSDVKTVYFMPMSNGLDQYLANRLTNVGLYSVVTDPKRADAVFVDRLGESFEARFKELFVPPEPPKKVEAKDPKDKDQKAVEDKSDATPHDSGRMSTFSRGRGNVFLVDVKTRTVLWSTFERPKDGRAAEVDRAAGRIIQSLQQTVAPKTK